MLNDEDGLWAACRGGQREIVDYDISRRKWHEGYSRRGGHENIEKLLILKCAESWYGALERLCQSGRINHVNFMFSENFIEWDLGLYEACRGSNKKIISTMISNGASAWNFGLAGACRGGHIEIVDLMISKGANDWNVGLDAACRGNHNKIIKLMINKSSNNCQKLK